MFVLGNSARMRKIRVIFANFAKNVTDILQTVYFITRFTIFNTIYFEFTLLGTLYVV